MWKLVQIVITRDQISLLLKMSCYCCCYVVVFALKRCFFFALNVVVFALKIAETLLFLLQKLL